MKEGWKEGTDPQRERERDREEGGREIKIL